MFVESRRLHIVKKDERPLTNLDLVLELSKAAVLTADSILRSPSKRKRVFSGFVSIVKGFNEVVTSSKHPLRDVVDAMTMDYVGSDSNLVSGRFKGCVNPSECCYPCSAPYLRLIAPKYEVPAKVIPLFEGVNPVPNG